MAYRPKTKPTGVQPSEFINSVESTRRRDDATVLLALFERVSGWKPYMFGPSIIGFGHYAYIYETGHSGTACCIGFSPRSANLVIYPGLAQAEGAHILARLGKHRVTNACIYVSKLSDIELTVLEELLSAGIETMKRRWTVTAS